MLSLQFSPDWSISMSRLDPRNSWRQLSYAIKNTLVASKAPKRNSPIGGYFLPYAGSLWHKGAYTFPCMEATYPLCHKEPARSKQRPVGSLRSKAPSRGLCMPELVLYGIRELA